MAKNKDSPQWWLFTFSAFTWHSKRYLKIYDYQFVALRKAQKYYPNIAGQYPESEELFLIDLGYSLLEQIPSEE